jgi:hypothetical protein
MQTKKETKIEDLKERIGSERIFLNGIIRNNNMFSLIAQIPDKGLVACLDPCRTIYRQEREKFLTPGKRSMDPDGLIFCYRKMYETETCTDVASETPIAIVHIEHWSGPYKYALLRVNAYQACCR